MQKKIIALALAGLASSAAFAQSNVTIYGRIDYGFVNRGSQDGGSANVQNKNEFASGVASGSRIGFKGAEDLGNGLKAIFQAEYATDTDSNTNAGFYFNRNQFVGLTGAFGTAIGGRVDGARYGAFGKLDPFANGSIGTMAALTPQVDRADNAVVYVSPNWNGLTVTLAHATAVAGQEAAGNNGDGRLYTAWVQYENGPLYLTFDHEQVRVKNVDGSNAKVTLVGGSYDFGAVKVSALYDIHDNEVNAATADQKRRTWVLGASVPFGKTTVRAAYGSSSIAEQDGLYNDTRTNKFAIGATYALSKRTGLYADYAKLSNDNAATQQLTFAGNRYQGGGAVAAHASAYGTSGFNVGLFHTF